MGDPIRAIFPCKTPTCSFKVARTSISGLCSDCNDREYRNKKKLLLQKKAASLEKLKRKVGASICSAAGCSNKLGNWPYKFCTSHMPKVA